MKIKMTRSQLNQIVEQIIKQSIIKRKTQMGAKPQDEKEEPMPPEQLDKKQKVKKPASRVK